MPNADITMKLQDGIFYMRVGAVILRNDQILLVNNGSITRAT